MLSSEFNHSLCSLEQLLLYSNFIKSQLLKLDVIHPN
jgi:hypothetical protein